jgi:hypothetical protein
MPKYIFKPTRASRLLGRGLRLSKRKRGSFRLSRRPPGLRARALTASRLYNVHHYKRYGTQIHHSALGPITAYNGVNTFDLSKVRNPSELTALYDQYMITGVKLVFKLTTNPDAPFRLNQSADNSTNWYPRMFYTRDYDNDTVETSNDLRERNTTKMCILRPNKDIKIFVKPAVRNQLYLDGVTAATSPVWNQWIDCSTTQVPHYGLKWSLDFENHTVSQGYQFTIETIYYLKFKNAR